MEMTQPIPTDRYLTHYQDEHSLAAMRPALSTFGPISLAEMDAVALLNRVDTKYLLTQDQLADTLRAVAPEYRVLEIEGVRLSRYLTLYFDTEDFRLYHQHHNGAGNRYKVRAREYLDSSLSFLEVKHKTNQNRTVKTRIRTPEFTTHVEDQIGAFAHEILPLSLNDLEPRLLNRFVRITLVGTGRPERVTIDLNLEFSSGEARCTLPGLVIAEVKQEHLSQQSAFVRQMRRQGVRPSGFSKYCSGVYLLCEDKVKTNAFKAQQQAVSNLIRKGMPCEYAY